MLGIKQRRWLALIGAALILLGVILVARNLSQHLSTVPVLRARRDLPAGIAIPPDAIAVVHIPAGARIPEALTSPEQVRDRWTLSPIFAGEYITSSRVGTAPPDRYEAALTDNAGLLSLPISPERVLGGILAPGDIVDVYLVDPEAGAALVADQVLVVDVRNRAAQTTYETENAPADPQGLVGMTDWVPAWVALRTPAEIAPRLMAAAEGGTPIYFYLKGRGEQP